MRRGLVTAVCALVIVGHTATPTLAQDDYPPGDATGSVTDASGDGVFAPGESGVATFQNLTPNEPYELDFEQSPGVILATGDTDADGDVAFNFTVPTTAEDGRATLTAQPVDGTGRVATVSITVQSPPEDDGDDGAVDDVDLPKTGSPIDRWAGGGAILVVVGLGLVGFAWRRRSRARHDPV